jgi:hypothetical protein
MYVVFMFADSLVMISAFTGASAGGSFRMRREGVFTSCLQYGPRPRQGCQMVYFKTKNLNLGIFWRALEWKMLVYFTTDWYNL